MKQLFLLFLLLLLPVAGFADGRPPIHVQLVLDSSGSMSKNDPKALSILAAMMFTDLAGPDDQLGVLTMRKNRFVLSEIAPVGANREKIRRSILSFPFSGPTFCAQPLDEALQGLRALKSENAEQFVIFLSDGACPISTAGADMAVIAGDLKREGIRVFSIALQNPTGSVDIASDLKTVASTTGGEFFSITTSKELPITFAKILGRIVGSEAQTISLKNGVAKVDLDGFAHDVSFIATGSRNQTFFTGANGPKENVDLAGARVPFSKDGNTYFTSAQQNGRKHYYSVLRLDEPSPGAWKVKAKVPKDVTGIMIQNFAIDPVVEVEGGTNHLTGQEVTLRVWLRGKEDARLKEERFLNKVNVSLSSSSPTGTSKTDALTYSGDGYFEIKVALTESGQYTFSARATMKKGGLNKTSVPLTVNTKAITLKLTPGQTLDLGDIKAGEKSGDFEIDFGSSELPQKAKVKLNADALVDVEVDPDAGELGPESTSVKTSFWVRPKHVGGPISQNLVVTFGEQRFEVPVRGNVIPLTFWERFGKIIMTIGLGLLALILLLIVVYGFLSPHSFGADARLNWGETTKRLNKNEIVIREIPRTGKGFYKNAKLVIGGASSFLPANGTEIAILEATGKNQITISAINGAELLAVNKFDEKKTKPVDGNACFMNTGELYQVGSLYLRLQ